MSALISNLLRPWPLEVPRLEALKDSEALKGSEVRVPRFEALKYSLVENLIDRMFFKLSSLIYDSIPYLHFS